MTAAPTSIEVRDLRFADLPAWEPILRQGIGEFERSTGLESTVDAQVAILRRRGIWALLGFLRLFGRSPVRVLVGVERTHLLGTATLLFLSRSGYVAGVATDAAARGRGVATRVLERAHGLARARHRNWAVLDVEAENETAIRLYRRFGYRDLAEYVWFAGPLPSGPPVPAPVSAEVPTPDRTLTDWVDALRPAEMRAALPAAPGLLSHLEIITNTPRPHRRTWTVANGDRTAGVVRGNFASAIRTGYLFPAVPEPTDAATRRALLAPAFAAHAALGGQRTVVAVPAPADPWEEVLRPLGVDRVVTTRTMLFPLAR